MSIAEHIDNFLIKHQINLLFKKMSDIYEFYEKNLEKRSLISPVNL